MSARPNPEAGPPRWRGGHGSLLTARRATVAPLPRRQYWSGIVKVSGDDATLALSGELDLSCQGELGSLLTRMESWPDILVVDLAAVTYADSYGLQVLFDNAQHRRENRLPALLLRAPGPFLARLLYLFGAQRVVDTEYHDHRERTGPPVPWYAC